MTGDWFQRRTAKNSEDFAVILVLQKSKLQRPCGRCEAWRCFLAANNSENSQLREPGGRRVA